MEHTKYYEAAIPEPFTILGLRLRPLSLGHILILHRVESPFLSDDNSQDITLDALAFAVFICSRSYAEGLSLLSDPTLSSQLTQWGRDVKSDLKKAGKEFNFKDTALLFLDYLETGLEEPDFKVTQDGTSPINAPSYQVVKVELMSKMGMSEAEVLDRPWRLCIWDFITRRALDGQTEFVDGGVYSDAQEQAQQLTEKLNKRNGQTTKAKN